jgi:FtsH-binding integral membrane protein
MNDDVVLAPPYEVAAEARSAFLRRVALWTVGGLFLTAIATLLSMMYVVPFVFRGGTWAVIAVVYGSFFLSQSVARKMVYGDAKVGGFTLGCGLQGVALGFLLTITLAMGRVEDGMTVIGYALVLTLLASLAMLAYVSIEKREFSLLRAGLSMLFIPMLLLMGLQLVFPIGGAFGMVIAAVFLAVSVGAMLWTLNTVVHDMPVNMATEAGFELALCIVVLFWNLLSLLNRLRR